MSAGAPVTVPNVERRLQALERQCASLEKENQRLLREALLGHTEHVRLVQTYKPTSESYPAAPANTFHIRFVDLTLADWIPGERTQTVTPRKTSEQAIASTFDKRFLLPNSICQALFHRRKWWIIGGPGLEFIGRTKATLNTGGTVECDLLEHNGVKLVDSTYDLTASDFYLNTGGTVEPKTKVNIRMLFPGKYYVMGAPCDPDSNEDAEYEP